MGMLNIRCHLSSWLRSWKGCLPQPCSLEQLVVTGLLITPLHVADVGHPYSVQSEFTVGDIGSYRRK